MTIKVFQARVHGDHESDLYQRRKTTKYQRGVYGRITAQMTTHTNQTFRFYRTVASHHQV